MDDKAGAAGLAALAICESLLLSLTESKVSQQAKPGRSSRMPPLPTATPSR